MIVFAGVGATTEKGGLGANGQPPTGDGDDRNWFGSDGVSKTFGASNIVCR